MADSAQNLKRRIRSVQNIGQITKAMELVAATKMRKAQELALRSRPFAYTALELLGIASNLKDAPLPELMRGRQVRKIALMLVTSDKGLAGSFNSSIIHKFERYVREENIDLRDPKYVFIAVGQKARTYFERRGVAVAHAFTRVGDFTTMEEMQPIADLLIEGYLRRDFDRALAFSTLFVTALRQEATVREFLPVSFEKVKESVEELVPQAGRYSQYVRPDVFTDGKEKEYIIEPSPSAVLEHLAPELLKIRVYSMILEANASEHSARRVAMKNASDNAEELSGELNVVYNKSRQAAITNQIIEVTSGAQTLS